MQNNQTTKSLPPPCSLSFPTGIICLKGKLNTVISRHTHLKIHKIREFWSYDSNSTKCDINKPFDYELREKNNQDFSFSGNYDGWFVAPDENGKFIFITVKKMKLCFLPNNEGFLNVIGNGENNYGRFKVSGCMKNDRRFTLIIHNDKCNYGSLYEYTLIIKSDTDDDDNSENHQNCQAYLPRLAKTNHPINNNEPKCTFTTV